MNPYISQSKPLASILDEAFPRVTSKLLYPTILREVLQNFITPSQISLRRPITLSVCLTCQAEFQPHTLQPHN